jgi:hypothetical protein
MKQLVFTVLVLGVLAMPQTKYTPETLAQIKAAKQDPTTQKWTEKVTVRVWANGKDGKPQFLDAIKDVDANRVTLKNPVEGEVRFRLHSRLLAHLGAKSEITDSDGKVYIISKITGTTPGYMIAHAVEQKPKP